MSEPATSPVRRRSVAALLALLMIVLALAGLVGAMALWATSEGGSAWLLSRVAGVELNAPKGRMTGGPFTADKATLRAGTRPVELQRLSWRDARWAFRPHDGAWVGLTLSGLRIERVVVGAADAAPTTGPVAAPTSLRLPIVLTIDPLQVGVLEVQGQTAASDIAAQVGLGHEQGSRHRIIDLSLRTALARVSGGVQIGTDAPFPFDAALQAASTDGAPQRWQADAQAAGPLAAISLRAQLKSPDVAGARFDAQATLAPFAAWPVSALQANLQDLDLAALAAQAPQTKLSGRATIDTQGLDKPMSARVTLSNALPGRWDQQRLPLATLELNLGGRADQRDVLTVQRFDARLAGDGGQATGRGEWRSDAATLDIALDAVRPAALDARAPPMTLGGTLSAKLSGLPAPDGSKAAAAVQSLQSTLSLDGRLDAAPKRSALPAAVRSANDQAAALRGSVQAQAGRDGRWRVQASGLEARAGASLWRGQASAERAADGSLQLATQGTSNGFDPSLWWAGPPPAKLNAQWQADVRAPAAMPWPPKDAAGWLALRGLVQLDAQDSSVAGVPLQVQAKFDGRDGNGWALDGDARAGGNNLKLQGRLAPRAADDRWRAEIDAPALASLRPLVTALVNKETRAFIEGLDGALAGQAQATGRWPALSTSGNLRGSALRAGAFSANKVAAQWQAGPDRDAPLTLTLEGECVAQGQATFESVRAAVEGTLLAHRVALDAGSSLRPPAWTDALLGTNGATANGNKGSRLQLRADGRWQPASPANTLAGQWQLRISQLDARGQDARDAWLAARDLQLQAVFDADTRPTQLQALPGKLTLLGAPLSWREARWSAAGAQRAAQLTLDAELEPLPIAPVLARLQPGDTGVSGNLTLKGRALVKSGAAFSADIVLERAGGDLTVSEDGDTQPLGLSDLRLALAADNGTWYFTQAVAGANLGVLAGALTVRVAPNATWPPPEAPMQGVLEWRVEDLGVWARFTPPGWRVAGQMRTSATFGGRFGAPEIEGRMEGRNLALRNLLQGVDLRDGELALSLRGADARIDRFVFKGGDGELRLTGDATLGATPSATVKLVADKFRLLGRADRRIVASGQGALALDAKTLALDGRLTIDEGLIDVSRADAPRLDDDVTVRGGRYARAAASAASAAAAAERAESTRASLRPAPRETRVAVQLDLGQQLRLKGRGLDTRLAGKLNITAPGGKLALVGTVNAVDGTYAAYGQKMVIERGVVSFAGEIDNPRLDIFAVRPNLDVKVGVLVGGTTQTPRVRLLSEPDMSDYDKLSWLVLGRASDSLARADTALLQRAALALFAGEGDGSNPSLFGTLGLDEVSVRQNESGEVRETVVTVGKQLSRRWYVGYERGVNSTTGTWQLVYRVAQRFTLRAQSGAENSLDAIWTWRWN